MVHFFKHLKEHIKRLRPGLIIQKNMHFPRHMGDTALDSSIVIPNTRKRITSCFTPPLFIFSLLASDIKRMNLTEYIAPPHGAYIGQIKTS